jgi:hypothetical protein
METPPSGMGCRALTFCIYGVMGTVVFFLMLASSILAHRARLRPNSNAACTAQGIEGFLAVLFRRAGKILGVINGLGIIAASTMQFAGVYDNCFCSASTFTGDPGRLLYLMDPTDISQSTVYKFWIGGQSSRSSDQVAS